MLIDKLSLNSKLTQSSNANIAETTDSGAIEAFEAVLLASTTGESVRLRVHDPPLLFAIPPVSVTEVPFSLTNLPSTPGKLTNPVVPGGAANFKPVIAPSSDALTCDENMPRLVEKPVSTLVKPPGAGEISQV